MNSLDHRTSTREDLKEGMDRLRRMQVKGDKGSTFQQRGREWREGKVVRGNVTPREGAWPLGWNPATATAR